MKTPELIVDAMASLLAVRFKGKPVRYDRNFTLASGIAISQQRGQDVSVSEAVNGDLSWAADIMAEMVLSDLEDGSDIVIGNYGPMDHSKFEVAVKSAFDPCTLMTKEVGNGWVTFRILYWVLSAPTATLG